MQKQPLAPARAGVSMVGMAVCGLVMMLATSACETVPVEPAPAPRSVIEKPIVSEEDPAPDPPERPIKPPGQ